MQYLFSDWSDVSKKVSRARYVLLCADFDGTITPIKPRPQEAYLGQQLHLLLNNISRNRYFFVGIISGRALRDLRQKVGIKGIIFAGNHGLELSYKQKIFIYPPAKRFIPVISAISRKLAEYLIPFPQAILENKRLSVSLHYRLVKKQKLPRLKKIFFQILRPYIDSQKVKLTYGKKVWEVRPPIEWDKGKAILWLLKRLRPKRMLPVYIGDDVTDEDAFRAVNMIKGISIFVGKKKGSSARYYLRSIKETRRFLKEILLLKSK